jgi:hypothetical protein
MSETTTAETTGRGSGTSTPDGATPGVSAARQERFARELDAVGHRTSRGDRRFVLASAGVMGVGVLLAVVAYAMSTGQSDTRDVLSSGILAMVGLALVVAGGAVFVRSSMTEFLRFWMLRLLYEQQQGTDDA